MHIPYCRDRCTYCAFTTIPDHPADHAQLVDALIREASGSLSLLPGSLRSLYLGGGTPGLLSPKLLERLLITLRGIVSGLTPEEVTLEVNPANVTTEALAAWSDLGINRLSVGIQTFDDRILHWLARRHDGETAVRALGMVSEFWQHSWSADLLVGWRGATADDVSRDTSRLLSFSPPHVSIYVLTVEPGTPLSRFAAKVDPTVNDSDICIFDDLYSYQMALSGLERYEVSNFARAGHRSLHNAGYWNNHDYVGLGPGASSAVHPMRWMNDRETSRYLQLVSSGRSPRETCEVVGPIDRLLESLGVGLRTVDGIPIAGLETRFGRLATERVVASAKDLVGGGFLAREHGRLRVLPRHLVRADRIITELVRSLLDGLAADP